MKVVVLPRDRQENGLHLHDSMTGMWFKEQIKGNQPHMYVRMSLIESLIELLVHLERPSLFLPILFLTHYSVFTFTVLPSFNFIKFFIFL